MTIADAISDAHSPARCRDVSLDLKSCYSCQMTSSLLPPFVSTYLSRRRIDWIKSKNVLFRRYTRVISSNALVTRLTVKSIN